MKSLTAAAVAVLLTTSAFAQTSQNGNAPMPSSSRPAGNAGEAPTNMHPSTAANTESAPSANRFTTNEGQGQWLVGNLWNKSVYNAAGKSIGDLNDVLIDKDGKVAAVIIGVGGFLGLGEKNVAVDYDYLQKNGGISPNRITLGMSEQDLRNAPAFQRSNSSANR